MFVSHALNLNAPVGGKKAKIKELGTMAIITDEVDVNKILKKFENNLSILERRGMYWVGGQSYTTISSEEVTGLVLEMREEMKQMFKRKLSVYD